MYVCNLSREQIVPHSCHLPFDKDGLLLDKTAAGQYGQSCV